MVCGNASFVMHPCVWLCCVAVEGAGVTCPPNTAIIEFKHTDTPWHPCSQTLRVISWKQFVAHSSCSMDMCYVLSCCWIIFTISTCVALSQRVEAALPAEALWFIERSWHASDVQQDQVDWMGKQHFQMWCKYNCTVSKFPRNTDTLAKQKEE